MRNEMGGHFKLNLSAAMSHTKLSTFSTSQPSTTTVPPPHTGQQQQRRGGGGWERRVEMKEMRAGARDATGQVCVFFYFFRLY
jgi:hypothetical protein